MLPPNRQPKIIRYPEVLKRTGFSSRTTIWQLIKDRQFPAPLQLTAHSVGWLEHDIDHWILSRPSTSPQTKAEEGAT